MVINQFPFGLSPKQYTKQFGLCQGTTDPHRCEMVGGFCRCTLKIEYVVPVEVFTSFVLWSASKAAGMQQTPPASTAPIGRNLQPGCWVGGKRENTRCQELLYKTPLLLQSRSAAVILYGDCRCQCALKKANEIINGLAETLRFRLIVWCAGRDSNPRPSDS